MALPETDQELVPFIINVPVFKSFLRHLKDLRAKRTALVNREKMKSPSSKKLVANIEDQIQLLNKVFLEICSSLTTSVEGLSINCHPITLDAKTAISLGSVYPSNLEAPSHEIANTIINDLVFKCIFRNMTALVPKETSHKSLRGKVDGHMSLLVDVISQICSMLTSYVEGFSYTPRHRAGICTRGAFVEGCYLKGIMKKPELKAKPSYLSVAKGLYPKGEVLLPSSPFTQGHTYSPYPGYYEGY